MPVDDRTRLNLHRKLEAVLGHGEADTLIAHPHRSPSKMSPRKPTPTPPARTYATNSEPTASTPRTVRSSGWSASPRSGRRCSSPLSASSPDNAPKGAGHLKRRAGAAARSRRSLGPRRQLAHVAGAQRLGERFDCRKRTCSRTALRSNASGSKPPPTHSIMSAWSSWAGSASTSSNWAYPPGPPQSSGGHARAPSRQAGTWACSG